MHTEAPYARTRTNQRQRRLFRTARAERAGPYRVRITDTAQPPCAQIGEAMAIAAAILLNDLIAYDADPRTKARAEGGRAVAKLFELKQAALQTGELGSFEDVARAHGGAELCKRSEGKLSAHLTGVLIDGILEALDNVTKQMSC